MPAPTIGCFGVGAMGAPIAGHLARTGFAVAVADPSAAAVEAWCARHQGAEHDASRADVIVTCVTDEPALRQLLLGEGDRAGLLQQARAGQLFIDHTTTSPRFARASAQIAAERGAQFVDAPLSGAAKAAQAGSLSAFVGGNSDAVARASTMMRHYAQRITVLGKAGSGQTGKLANQIAIAGIVRGLTEAVALGRAAGLDIAALLEALGAGSARSNQLEQHAAKLTEPAVAFADAFQWLDKDLALALDEAAIQGTKLEQTALIHRLLQP